MAEMETCSNPGCDQPGTNKCSACKTTLYCGPICQTTDWPGHKEECPGHLRKVGMAHFEKAKGFYRQRNFEQSLRFCESALTKLKKLTKDIPLHYISETLGTKCDALQFMGRENEALEISKEKYRLWATARGPANPDTIEAAFALIQCCLRNKQYADAELFARTLWEILNSNTYHFEQDRIPDDQLQEYLARGAKEYACAIWKMAESGGIPPAEKQKAGEQSIALARRAMEGSIQVHGNDSAYVATSMGILASTLDYFNDVDNIEVIGLLEQAIAIYARVQGTVSMNVAVGEYNLGNTYCKRFQNAMAVDDLERAQMNVDLAIPHHREAARIFTAINHMDSAAKARQNALGLEEQSRHIAVLRAAASAAANG